MKRFSVCLLPLFFLLGISFLLSCSQSCSLSGTGMAGQSKIKVLNWNLETFFDGNFDGNEYDEFKNSSSGWNSDKYSQRLERLAEVIKSVDPDVIVMEELEKEEQLHDIYNRLCSSFNLSKNYSWGCFSKEEGSSIGCGVMSRYPLSAPAVHSMDMRSVADSQPSVRPVMQVDITVKNKVVRMFVNHWKSKSGGELESQIWRDYQEEILADCLRSAASQGIPAFACGDFNKDIQEFRKVSGKKEGNNIVLKGKEDFPVYSPWYDELGNLITPGSYCYNSQWERIDHFFGGRKITVTDFKVEKSGPWAGENGLPSKYYVKWGTGYSDHLPVSCVISW